MNISLSNKTKIILFGFDSLFAKLWNLSKEMRNRLILILKFYTGVLGGNTQYLADYLTNLPLKSTKTCSQQKGSEQSIQSEIAFSKADFTALLNSVNRFRGVNFLLTMARLSLDNKSLSVSPGVIHPRELIDLRRF